MKNIIFGTGGFRAIIGEGFTKENVQIVCQSICNLIHKYNKQKKICLGYDYRFMSEEFACWSAEVFAGNDIEVELMDSATTTPVVMYATKKNSYNYGMMITASHNPYNYNGVKIFIDEGKDAGIDETQEIEKEAKEVTTIKTKPFEEAIKTHIKYVNYLNDYIDNIIKVTELNVEKNSLKVVYDAKFGSSVEEIKMLSKAINLNDFEIINDTRDAFFGGEQPTPIPTNISGLKSKVIEKQADIGFALDADGDRLAVVDKNGNYIDNNYILSIIYYYLVRYKGLKGDSVKNVATSILLDKVTKNFGYTCHEVPVGFKWVSSAIIKNNAVVGGESSGGLAVQGHIWGKDSLIAIAFCLKSIIDMKKPFHEILEEVKAFGDNYSKSILDTQYMYNEEDKKFIDETLYIKKLIPYNIKEIDKIVYDEYVKVYYKNEDWALVRFSGTEPILRLFVESNSLEESQKMIKDWEKLLKLKEPIVL